MDWKVELEFRWQLLLRIQAIGEINSAKSTVCMNLHPECLDVICAVRSLCKISEVQLNVVPAIIKLQWHCADIWLYPCNGLQKGFASEYD